MNETESVFSKLSQGCRETLYVSFMSSIYRHMTKPETSERYREWLIEHGEEPSDVDKWQKLSKNLLKNQTTKRRKPNYGNKENNRSCRNKTH